MSQFDSIRFQPSRPLLKEITADRLNSILQEIRRVRPKGEKGISIRQTGEGTYIGLAASIKGGAIAATRQPWDLLAAADPDDEHQYKVTVQPGTLSGFLADNWDDEFTCSDTGLYYAKAVVATDGTAITGVTINIDESAPEQQTPEQFAIDSEVEYLFGLFSEGRVYRVIGAGHIEYFQRLWLTKPTDLPAAPGELAWVNYYALQ